MINAFATFFILSYNKVCTTSLSLMQPVKVWDKYGNLSWRIYFDAQHSVDSREYIVSASLASTITMVAVILPALFILVYQNKAFRKCLFICKIKCVLIHEMAKLLQSGFKDGSSQGTRDYRWFAGFYLLLRVILVFLLGQEHCLAMYVTIFSILSLLVATLRPYKVNRYNVVDSMVWLSIAIFIAWYSYLKVKGAHLNGVIYGLGSFSIVYILYNICFAGVSFIIKWKRSQNAERAALISLSTEADTLPDRLVNPTRYKL